MADSAGFRFGALALIGGAVLLGLVYARTDWVGIGAQLASLGAGALLIPIPALLWFLPSTLAWAFAFARPKAPFSDLLVARLAGEGLNDLLPMGGMGGEPVKALLLRPAVSTAEAASALVVNKASEAVAIPAFILFGLSLAEAGAGLPGSARAVVVAVAAGLGLGAGLLVYGGAKGVLGAWGNSLLARFRRFQGVDAVRVWVASLDESLTSYFKTSPARFAAAAAWHAAGLMGGAVELLLLAKLAGIPMSLAGAVSMEAVALAFSVAGAFIPSSLGFFELGHLSGALMLGFPPESGVLISAMRRCRELVFLAVGAVVLHWKTSSGPRRAV